MHSPDHEYKYYKVEIHNLTQEQKDRVQLNSYARRFVRNYFLALYREEFPNNNIPRYSSSYVGHKITELRSRLPWLAKIDRTVLKYAVKDLNMAYDNYKAKISRKPVFHRAKYDKVRFASRPESLRFFGEGNRYAHIAGLSTRKDNAIDLKNHNIPVGVNVEYQNVRVSFDGEKYWLSVSVYEYPLPYSSQQKSSVRLISEPIGIDVGLVHSAVCSDGTFYDSPNHRKLQIYNRRVDVYQSLVKRNLHQYAVEANHMGIPYDQIPKSKNQLKREFKLMRAYKKLTNVYKTHNHQIAASIAARNPAYVVLESLSFNYNMKDKVPSHKLRRHIKEGRLCQLVQFIDTKCTKNGIRVIKAYPGFKSSQICSNCGEITNMGLSRTYKCPHCGLVIDRDLNAAINLRNYGKGI